MPFLENKALLPSSLSPDERTRCEKALRDTRIVIARGIDWRQVFASLQWPNDTALLCDNHTYRALGQQVTDALQADGYRITLINLGSNPHPNEETADYVCAQAKGCSALIAVGSGTLNDLAKYSASRLKRPYAICGTAPSMNGYLSANAAITLKGHKQSLPATLPAAALFDLDVLQTAPDRLHAAGVGDSACRSTAQADWLLSHHLLDTAYDALPFKLLQPYEAEMLKGKTQALITTLLLSGLGMTLCGGSHPASQGEHLVAHYMDMRYPDTAKISFHGEQIAVTTLFMASLQHSMLSGGVAQWHTSRLPDEADCIAHFGAQSGGSVWKEWNAKLEAIGPREAFNERLAKKWPEIIEEIRGILIPVAAIERGLKQAGAPRMAQDIGWTAEQFDTAARHAHLIRNRFTFLDLSALARG
jgi:glycerol-1-phosphate dehydrogenase [NAD(P)+]